jgi:hypothetical protein
MEKGTPFNMSFVIVQSCSTFSASSSFLKASKYFLVTELVYRVMNDLQYYRLQAKLNICVKYTVHKTQLAESKMEKLRAILLFSFGF